MAIEHLNFTVRRGEIVAIVGKTGCGKSTFFNIMVGLEHPTEGVSRSEAGHPTATSTPSAVTSASSSQDRFYPGARCSTTSRLGWRSSASIRPSSGPAPSGGCNGWDSRAFSSAFPNEFRGMRQRPRWRPFAVNPEILLANEAFGDLDEVTARQIRGQFFDMVRAERKTAILVSTGRRRRSRHRTACSSSASRPPFWPISGCPKAGRKTCRPCGPASRPCWRATTQS